MCKNRRICTLKIPRDSIIKGAGILAGIKARAIEDDSTYKNISGPSSNK